MRCFFSDIAPLTTPNANTVAPMRAAQGYTMPSDKPLKLLPLAALGPHNFLSDA